MDQATKTRTEEMIVELMGGRVRVLTGGRGDPLVVLHRDNGYPGWQPFHDQLAGRFTVYIPSLPGYQGSDPDSWTWVWDVRDLAAITQRLLKHLGLARVTVVGLGFGGWLAAEMATACDERFQRMVLVGPMGIQPKQGDIFDQFLVGSSVYARTAFHDQRKFEELYGANPEFEQLERWETDREMTCRVAWKPYMHNRNLARLLRDVQVPALVVWGREDRIVPLECGQLYAEALPRARLEVIDACGHAVDLEKPDQLARLILDFAQRA